MIFGQKVNFEYPEEGYFYSHFSLDLRSLSLFRVFLGLVVIGDQVKNIVTLFSQQNFPDQYYHWSILHLFSDPCTQLALKLLTIISALFLILGFHTRFFCFSSWLLLILSNLNSHELDKVVFSTLELLLFWSIFLPTGARFSIDEARLRRLEHLNIGVFSPVSCALLIQISYAFWIEWFFLGTSDLTGFLSITFASLSLIIPCLLFLPIMREWIRILVIIAMVIIALGTEQIIFNDFDTMARLFSWSILIPGRTWDWAKGKLRTEARMGLKIFYDGQCSFCQKLCLILKSFFLIRETPVVSADEYTSVQQDMEIRNSWVVIDYTQKRFYEAEALVVVVANSPILFPLSWLISIKPVLWLLTKGYRLVANNRSRFSLITRFIHFENSQN